jgi:hypothetical protein
MNDRSPGQVAALAGTLAVRRSEEGGRRHAIYSGYLPDAVLHPTLEPSGTAVPVHGICIRFEGDPIDPGASARVTIEPRYPEYWANVRPGQEIGVFEGPHRVATFTVEQVTLSGAD